MRKLLGIILTLMVSTNAFSYNTTYNAFTSKLDYVGADKASDIKAPCSDGQTLIFTGGVAACGSGGGGGSPAGSSGQLQYNNAGSFAAISGLNWDAVTTTLKGLAGTNINWSAISTITLPNASLVRAATNWDSFWIDAASGINWNAIPGGAAGKILMKSTSGINWTSLGSNGIGNVIGPSSATDNAVARFDGTTGKIIQNSGVTIDDSGNMVVGSGTSGLAPLLVKGPFILEGNPTPRFYAKSNDGNGLVVNRYSGQESYAVSFGENGDSGDYRFKGTGQTQLQTGDSTTEFQSPTTDLASSENDGFLDYAQNDVIDYMSYPFRAAGDGTTFYTANPETTSTTITNALGGAVDVSFSLPGGATGVRILRQVNGGGYNDYRDETTGFTDENSGWTGGNTVTPAEPYTYPSKSPLNISKSGTASIPTTSNGLSTGDVWSDGGTLKIVS